MIIYITNFLNIFLDDAKLAELWFVRRPGSNGIVHSIEAYDDRRNLVRNCLADPPMRRRNPKRGAR